jgi:hypothetical protein
MRWAGNLARTGEDSNKCTVLVRKHDGRSRCRWEDNTKMDLKAQAAFEGGKWGDRPRHRASGLRSSV